MDLDALFFVLRDEAPLLHSARPKLSVAKSLSELRDRWHRATSVRQAEGTQSALSTMAKPPFCSKAINDLQCASIARASPVRLKMGILFESICATREQFSSASVCLVQEIPFKFVLDILIWNLLKDKTPALFMVTITVASENCFHEL